MSKFLSSKFDYVGMLISIICGVHCLVTPLLIISVPRLGEGLQSVWVHTGLISLMLFAFYQSIYLHFKIHKVKSILFSGLIGLTLILSTYLNEIFFSHHEHEHEHGHSVAEAAHTDETIVIILSIVGALFLITSHILNLKECKCLRLQGACKK